MKQKNLWILLTLVVALVSYAIWDYKKDVKAEETKEQAKTLTIGDINQITELSIKTKDLNLKLKKEEGSWQIYEPILYTADSAVVEEFLKGILNEKSIETLEKDQDLKNFGLDQPLGTIEIKLNGNLKQYQVGSIKSYNGDVYLIIDNLQPIYLASSTWSLKLEKKLFDFREKRIFSKSSNLIDKIVIDSKGRKEELLKKQIDGKDLWQLSNNQYKIDQNTFRNVMGVFNSPEVKEFVAEGSSYNTDKAKLGLDTLLSQLTVFYPEGKASYRLYQNKNKDYFLDDLDKKRIYKVSENFNTYFTLTSTHPYRDMAEPFNFAKDQIKEIRLYLDRIEYVFIKKDNKWLWKNEQPNMTYDDTKTDVFVNLLSAFTATKFSDSKSFIQTPKKPQKLEFFNDKSELLASYIFSEKSKQKVNSEEVELVPVKSSLSSEVFYIRSSQLDDLKLNEVVKAKTQ